MTTRTFILIGLLFGSNLCSAQGTISDGTAIFTRNGNIGIDNANYSVGGGLDHVYEDNWFYRVEEDTRERFFSAADTEAYNGSVSTLTWSDLGLSDPFDAQLVSTIHEGADGVSSFIQHEMTITNTGSNVLVIAIFGYLDLDLNNTTVGEQAELLNNPQRIEIFEDETFSEFHGLGASAFQVTETVTGGSLRVLFSDLNITNLDNTGLPFGPADWEGAYQWDATIAPGGSSTFTKIYTINRTLTGIFGDGFESGDTSAWQ